MAVTKRYIALLIAVIIPAALILSGCGKRLTAKEYYEELYADFKEYAAAVKEIELVRPNVTSSQEIMVEQTKATEICEKAAKALEKFDKINPPKQFAEKHKAFLEAVELEKKFVSATEKVLTARTPAEAEQYATEATMVLAGVPEEKQFAALLLNLISEAKAAADNGG